MTKYDFRIRRQLFQRSRGSRFQNFEALEKKYRARKRLANIVRLTVILLATILLIGVMMFTAKAEIPADKQTLPEHNQHQVSDELNR